MPDGATGALDEAFGVAGEKIGVASGTNGVAGETIGAVGGVNGAADETIGAVGGKNGVAGEKVGVAGAGIAAASSIRYAKSLLNCFNTFTAPLTLAADFWSSSYRTTTIEANMANGIIRLNDGWRMNEGHRLDEPPHLIPPVTPPVQSRSKGNKLMTQDYVPNKRNDRKTWYANLSANVVAEAVKFGGLAADATAVKTAVDGVITKMGITNTAQDAVDSARTLEGNAEQAALALVRAKVASWKTLSGWANSGSADVLEVIGSSTTFDPATYQTTLTVSVVPGGVQLGFVKKGAEGVAIYSRLIGAASWKKIGSANHSPFIDHTPLAVANVPEQRQYMARGLVHDAEIGLDSDAVGVTYAG